MSDYKEMYFRLFRATEDAMELLIKAQRECEEMYLSAEDEAEEKEKPSPLRGGRCPAGADEGDAKAPICLRVRRSLSRIRAPGPSRFGSQRK